LGFTWEETEATTLDRQKLFNYLTVFYRTNIIFCINSFHQSATAAAYLDQDNMNSG